jgi:putative ABC transport system permease protein
LGDNTPTDLEIVGVVNDIDYQDLREKKSRQVTLDDQLEDSLVTERMVASVSTGFTILAVLLAALGLYGVLAYVVTQRARELGIRVALGASSRKIVWLVMSEVVQMIVAGVAVSIPFAFLLGRFIQSELYGVSASDPASIAAAAALLCGIATIAGLVPARRAASSDPLRVLRYE